MRSASRVLVLIFVRPQAYCFWLLTHFKHPPKETSCSRATLISQLVRMSAAEEPAKLPVVGVKQCLCVCDEAWLQCGSLIQAVSKSLGWWKHGGPKAADVFCNVSWLTTGLGFSTEA